MGVMLFLISWVPMPIICCISICCIMSPKACMELLGEEEDLAPVLPLAMLIGISVLALHWYMCGT